MASFPLRYVVFDTETVRTLTLRKGWHCDQRLRLGVAKVYDPVRSKNRNHRYEAFTTPDEFLKILDEMPLDKEKVFVLAHNMGFDARMVHLFRMLGSGEMTLNPPSTVKRQDRYPEPTFAVDDSPFILRSWRRDGQQFLWLDLHNWLPQSLRTIGNWIGEQKGTMPAPEAPDDEWWAYCQRDVEVTDAAFRRLWGFLQYANCKCWLYTPASQSKFIFEGKYAKNKVIRPRDIKDLRLDRMAYYGGYVEAYLHGRIDTTCTMVDINAMYPRVMKDHAYPVEVIDSGKHRGGPLDTWRRDEKCCTAEVWIDSPDTPYPIKCLDRTLWVRGKVHTVLCGPDLAHAVESGHVIKVGRWVEYRLESIFSKYVDWLWYLRVDAQRQGNKMHEYICKTLINSLHGKYGQHGGDWVLTIKGDDKTLFGAGRSCNRDISKDYDWKIMNGNEYIRVKTDSDPKGFVPIAAWTTAYARQFMNDMKAIACSENIHYQNCDALLLNDAGVERIRAHGLLDTGLMGQFKTVWSDPSVEIFGPNRIRTPNRIVVAGVKKNAVRNEDGTYTWEEWEQTGSALSEGHASSACVRTVTRNVFDTCSPRNVGLNGRTVPYTVSVWTRKISEMADMFSEDVLKSGKKLPRG